MANDTLTFVAFLHRFIALYQQGDYAQALHLIETDGPRFSEEAAQIMAWQGAMLSRLGRVDEAIQVFEAADARGFWYQADALRGDPDFAPLQNNPRFIEMVQRTAARRSAAIQHIRPERKVIAPAGPGPHPLCLVLHGNSSSIYGTLPHWQPLVEQGWAVAVLQSAQPGWASGTYVWDDIETSLAEVKAHVADLTADPAFDPRSLVSAGFSMGATIAVRMALDPAFALRGVIAHEAWFPQEDLADLEQVAGSAPPTPARVLLLAGQGNSEFIDMAEKVSALFSRHGFPNRVVQTANPRHDYPPDFAQVLAQAVDWITRARGI